MGVFVAHLQINRLKRIARSVHWRLKRFSIPILSSLARTVSVYFVQCMHACMLCDQIKIFISIHFHAQHIDSDMHAMCIEIETCEQIECIEREAKSRMMSACVQWDYRNGYLGALNIVVDRTIYRHRHKHIRTPSFQTIINYIRPFNQAISIFLSPDCRFHCIRIETIMRIDIGGTRKRKYRENRLIERKRALSTTNTHLPCISINSD